jgi:large subunit ribosomal protein L25
MKSIAISGSLRENEKKQTTKQLRAQDIVPCVLYGGKEQVHFAVPAADFKKLVYTAEVLTADLTIDGKSYSAIMQDIQFHPVSEKILHIDFLELIKDKLVTVEIPVKITGSAPGVKEGGKLVTKVRKLKVKALPKDLPDSIEVKIDKLEIGKSIRVADLKVKNVEILNAPNNIVTSVVTTRNTVVATDAAAAPAKK